jgi:RNA polymerase sigma-70 factor, ECF subfamily
MTDPPAPAALAFTRDWQLAQPAVSGFVRALIGNRDAAEDVLQEVAADLWRSYERYDPARPFIAWALAIAKHKIQDHRRQRPRPLVDPQVIADMVAVAEEMEHELSDRRHALQACLQGVRGRSWDLVRLRYHEGREPSEVATMLGLEAGHVRVLLNRVRDALRSCIERSLRSAGDA